MMRSTNGIRALALVALAATAGLEAQGGAVPNPKAMPKEKIYTGCVTAGAMAGSFTLTHAVEEMAGAMRKDAMGKESMGHPLSITSTAVDLSRHVGHQVSVTVAEGAMAKSDAMGKDTMAKPDAMAKPGATAAPAPVLTVNSLRMIAAKCAM